MNRFYLPEIPEAPGAEANLPPEEAHHLARVKRIGAGERVLVFDGEGREAEAEVVAVRRGGGEVRVRIVGAVAAARELAVRIILGVAPPRGKRMQVLLEKATELGAAAILPLVTARSVVDVRGRDEMPEKWRRTTIEAAKQSGVRRVPAIRAPLPLEAALSEPADVRLLLHPGPGAAPIRDFFPPAGSTRPASALVLVGPEGGFTEDEVARARAAGLAIARLGPTVLRVETAAIAAVATIAALVG